MTDEEHLFPSWIREQLADLEQRDDATRAWWQRFVTHSSVEPGTVELWHPDGTVAAKIVNVDSGGLS